MVQRPRLELPISEPVEIELMYDDCVSGSSQYGPYYLYAVKSEGREYCYFPTDDIHNELKALRRGDRVEITKIPVEKGNKIVPEFRLKRLEAVDKDFPKKNDQPEQPYINPEKDRYYNLLLNSCADALDIQAELNGLIDVNKIAITLFIARSK